jgi:hypothetical protein
MEQWMLKWTWPWTPDDGSIAAETRVGLMNIPKRIAFVGLIVERVSESKCAACNHARDGKFTRM